VVNFFGGENWDVFSFLAWFYSPLDCL